MKSTLITVIIPTRDRAETLAACLRTVVTQTYSNLRIIVSDNFSSDSTKEVVLGFNDDRIVYFNTGSRLSMSHNWEFALAKVTDGWVTLLGDDDGLLPGALETVADMINKTGAKALMSAACFYHWPTLIGHKYGRLTVPLGKGAEIRSGRVWLNKLMSGKVDISQLPTLYTGGFFCSSVINLIRQRDTNRQFYHSPIPDVYSAIAISSVIDSFVFVREPLSITGLSKNSTGTSVMNGEQGANSPAKQFYDESNIPFHLDIPMCPDGRIPSSVQAYKYESYLQSTFLRTDTGPPPHAKQLSIILSQTGRLDFSTIEWAKQFAAMHGISYDRAKLKSVFINLFLRFESIPRSIRNSFNQCSIESPKLPIFDVYEASIAVAAIGSYSLKRRFINIFQLYRKFWKFFGLS